MNEGGKKLSKRKDTNQQKALNWVENTSVSFTTPLFSELLKDTEGFKHRNR